MNPSSHGQFCDEDVAAFGEQDWSFSTDHLDLGISLHDFLDSCKWELMKLVIMVLGLEFGHLVLPVCVEDVSVVAYQALRNLFMLLVLPFRGVAAYE